MAFSGAVSVELDPAFRPLLHIYSKLLKRLYIIALGLS